VLGFNYHILPVFNFDVWLQWDKSEVKIYDFINETRLCDFVKFPVMHCGILLPE